MPPRLFSRRRWPRSMGLGYLGASIDDTPVIPADPATKAAAPDLSTLQQLVDADAAQVAQKQLPAHLFMPADGVAFDFSSYIALPAVAATSTIVSFTVPEGFHGVINRIANVYVGTGFVEGSGSLVWQILANGAVVRNYDNIVASLGGVTQPSTISGILIKEGQLVVLQIQNVSLAVGGAQSGGRLGGYFYPTSHEPDDAWL